MPNRAFLFGIDNYNHPDLSNLEYCVQNVLDFAPLLYKHENGESNFDYVDLHAAVDDKHPKYEEQTRQCLALQGTLQDPYYCYNGQTGREGFELHLNDFLTQTADLSLIYISGHGTLIEDKQKLKGALVLNTRNKKILSLYPLEDLIDKYHKSNANSKILILDLCYAGAVGNFQNHARTQYDNLMIIASCNNEKARENSGFFTILKSAFEQQGCPSNGEVTSLSIANYFRLNRTTNQQLVICHNPIIDPKIFRKVSISQPELTSQSIDKFSDISLIVKNSVDTDNRFHFTSDWIPFVGRSEEIKEINEFLVNDEKLKVWFIVGAGGQGKSRLARQLASDKEKEGWRAGFLNAGTPDLDPKWVPNKNTLIIVDYPNRFPNLIPQIVAWQEPSKNWLHKVKFLLLEREDSIVKIEVGEQPFWKSMLFKKIPFSLEKLEITDILTLMKGVFSTKQVIPPSDNDLLDTVDRIDPDFKRPLFAAYIADALSDPDFEELTSREELLERLINKEESRWRQILLQNRFVHFNNIDSFKRLLFISTMMGGCSDKNILMECNEKLKYCLPNELFPDAVKAACVQMIGNSSSVKFFAPIEPDLYGEWYLLNFDFQNLGGAYEKILTSIPWEKPDSQIEHTFYRLMNDFPQQQNKILDLIEKGSNSEQINVLNRVATAYYYFVLTTVDFEPQNRINLLSRAFNRFESLTSKDPNILNTYNHALFSLSFDSQKAIESFAISKITTNEDSLNYYLLQQSNQTDNYYDLDSRQNALAKLEHFSHNSRTAEIYYFMSLARFACDEEISLQTIANLKTENENFRNRRKLKLYASGLYQVINNLDYSNIDSSFLALTKLEDLYNRYNELSFIRVRYLAALESYAKSETNPDNILNRVVLKLELLQENMDKMDGTAA